MQGFFQLLEEDHIYLFLTTES